MHLSQTPTFFPEHVPLRTQEGNGFSCAPKNSSDYANASLWDYPFGLTMPSRSSNTANPNYTYKFTLYAYDREGRLETQYIYSGERRAWDTEITYIYNRLGEVTRRKLQVDTYTLYHHYTYTPLGQLKELTPTTDDTVDTETPEITYTYHNDRSLKQKTFKSGTTLAHTYDIQGRLERIQAPIFSAEYTYANNGNITRTDFYNIDLQQGMQSYRYRQTYGYDALSRLTSADYSTLNHQGNPSLSSAYDSEYTYYRQGNITSLKRNKETGTTIDNVSYTYGLGNRLLSINDAVATTQELWDAEDASYGYDANGNMISQSGKISRITYDHRNLPLNTDLEDGSTLVAHYNAAGMRVLKEFTPSEGGSSTYTWYVRYGDETLATIDEKGKINVNVLGQGIEGQWVDGASPRYFIKDHLGSTRGIVNSQGNSQAS